jgi:diguanylate cyclase (GGDEF)-like protein
MRLTSDSHDVAPPPRRTAAWATPLAGVALWLVFELDRRTGSAPVQHLYYLHLAGAEAVRLVGHTLAASLPADASACRYGGDEFAVAVASCDEVRATAVAEELRRAVHALAPVLAGTSFPIHTLSISVGFACLHDRAPASGSSDRDARTGESLFRAADKALYAAKKQGRNRVDVRVPRSAAVP